MALGGLIAARALAQEAWARGCGVVVTTSLDGAIARAGALHLACALAAASPAPLPACGLATAAWLAEDLCPDPHPVGRGRMTWREVPGLGVPPEALGADPS
jgi:L-alanine-DL-glutamate epimerase-like enolase superfamily enzyme